MVNVDEQGRPQPPSAGEETATLTGFLDFQRATLEWKTNHLDSAALQRTVGASSMTLGGILKHMAAVEDWWFSYWLQGNDQAPPWCDVDWDGDPDWEWRTAADDAPDELRGLWKENIERVRPYITLALHEGGPGTLAKRTGDDGGAPSLRWILCHMIEEYARHNGHADLIRESIDGETGE
jgi:uncharacterized damage-inducible protein DinB